jgi:prefoldin subunit 5
MASLTPVLKQLQQERNRLAAQLENLNQAISALNGSKKSQTGARSRVMSLSARKRIAAAQRARWAKWKAQQKRAA